MKKVVVGILSVLLTTTLLAQDGPAGGNKSSTTSELVIYKWVTDGITTYAHVLPDNVTNYEKLDGEGFLIEELPDDFKVEGNKIVRPNAAPNQEKKSEDTAQDDTAKKADDAKQTEQAQKDTAKACELAKSNMKKLEGNQVFEMTSGGVKVLEGDALKARREENERVMKAACGE